MYSSKRRGKTVLIFLTFRLQDKNLLSGKVRQDNWRGEWINLLRGIIKSYRARNGCDTRSRGSAKEHKALRFNLTFNTHVESTTLNLKDLSERTQSSAQDSFLSPSLSSQCFACSHLISSKIIHRSSLTDIRGSASDRDGEGDPA